MDQTIHLRRRFRDGSGRILRTGHLARGSGYMVWPLQRFAFIPPSVVEFKVTRLSWVEKGNGVTLIGA
jgi:hypothetical protein